MNIVVECFWLVIAILSALIVYEFYNSKGNVNLRICIIWFFISLAWLYFSPFVFMTIIYAWHLKNINIDLLKLILTFPMFVSMIFLYRFIKFNK